MPRIKLRYCVLGVALSLITSYVMGKDRKNFKIAAEEAVSRRDEAEDSWARKYQSYSASQEESRGSRSRSRNKKSEPRGSHLWPEYKSPY